MRLSQFRLRVLPNAVTFRGTRAGLSRNWNALPTANKGKPANQIKPLSNESARHTRRQNTRPARGAGLDCLDIFTARPTSPKTDKEGKAGKPASYAAVAKSNTSQNTNVASKNENQKQL
jgi:hypothetical protein